MNPANAKNIHELLHLLYDKLVKYQPVEKLLKPKNIATPGGYASPIEAASLAHEGIIIGHQIAKAMREGNPEPFSLRHTVVTTSIMAIREGMPIYYVSEDFIRAVAATQLPEDIRIEEIAELKWPGGHQACVLGFPQRFMRDYIGQDISYVTIANCKKGEYSLAPMLNGFPTMDVPRDKFICHTMIWVPATNRPENALVAWWQDDFMAQASKRFAYTDMTGSDENTIKYKKQSNDMIGNLVLKLLLILSVRDGLVVEGKLTRPEKRDARGRIEQNELWEPSTIGWNYRILEAKTREAKDEGQRGERVYTPHQGWIQREGHLTHQFVGKRDVDLISTKSLPKLSTGEIDWASVPKETQEAFWAQHKRIWIEPIWYNPAEAK